MNLYYITVCIGVNNKHLVLVLVLYIIGAKPHRVKEVRKAIGSSRVLGVGNRQRMHDGRYNDGQRSRE